MDNKTLAEMGEEMIQKEETMVRGKKADSEERIKDEEIDRGLTQAFIVDKFGEDYVRAEQERLCDNCTRRLACSLLPVTTKGESCCYYDHS